MRSIRSVAVGAGFFFVTLALFVQGVLPAMIPESRSTPGPAHLRGGAAGGTRPARFPSAARPNDIWRSECSAPCGQP